MRVCSGICGLEVVEESVLNGGGSEVHSCSGVFKKSMVLWLRWMIVERWEKQVLSSVLVSHVDLDF